MIKKLAKKVGGGMGLNEVRDDLGEVKYLLEQNLKEQREGVRAELLEMQRKIDVLRAELTEEVKYTQDLIKTVVDIRKVPERPGMTSLLQRGNLQFLLAVERFLQAQGMGYFLDYGTLLGAVRHGGFIPWDDDLDIAMNREDFNRLLKILEKRSDKNGVHMAQGEILRLYYKNSPLQVDIFPFDFYPERLDAQGEDRLRERLNQLHDAEFEYDWSKLFKMEPVSGNKTYAEAEQLRREVLGPDVSFAEAKRGKLTIVRGIEYMTNGPGRVFSFETVYPLREMNFCGHKMYVPNRAEECLRMYYDDFWEFPRDIRPKHEDINVRINEETIDLVERVVAGKEKIVI